jgi:hypothetical protein
VTLAQFLVLACLAAYGLLILCAWLRYRKGDF